MESKNNQKTIHRLAKMLDAQFAIPFTQIRFGFDFIIGLVPGLGDSLSSLISLYIINLAIQQNVPFSVVMHMFFNVVVDQIIGSIPIIGDLFDIYWKANLKNAKLLDQCETNPQKQNLKSKLRLTLILICLALITAALGYLPFLLADIIRDFQILK